jgi:hypothetical protein
VDAGLEAIRESMGVGTAASIHRRTYLHLLIRKTVPKVFRLALFLQPDKSSNRIIFGEENDRGSKPSGRN